jgi:hypothetical protein
MEPAMHRCSRPFAALSPVLVVALSLAFVVGCSRPPWPSSAADGRHVLDRLEQRRSTITSATYRVRWRARGTDPHGEFLLDIAYKSPDKFRVSANGPLGVLVFTAVVRGEEFWFIDHPNNQITADSLQNLGDYELPLAEFFTGLWRDLFSGGWGGGSGVGRLLPSHRRGWYEGAVGNERIAIRWDQRHDRPAEIEVRRPGDDKETVARIECRFGGDIPPYWELDRLRLEGFPGGGTHTWSLLRQTYNIEVPDRLFLPLDNPLQDRR